MNTLIIIISSILCPIMLVLVICNCYIKYKRQQYLEKVRIAQTDIEQRIQESKERRMSRRMSAMNTNNLAELQRI